MAQSGHSTESEEQPVEFVGAPTEYADVQEVPAWVANVTKLLFFLPTAYATAVAIPAILLGFCLLCVAAFAVLAALL